MDKSYDSESYDMMTITGHPVWFQHPERYTVNDADILIYTAGQRRFNGGIDWCLLEHHELCHQLYILWITKTKTGEYWDLRNGWLTQKGRILDAYISMHDEHEIIVRDMPSGIKKHIPDYQDIEWFWEEHFHKSQGFPFPLSHEDYAILKYVDKRAQIIEMAYFSHPGGGSLEKLHGGPATHKELRMITDIKKQFRKGTEAMYRDISERKDIAKRILK